MRPVRRSAHRGRIVLSLGLALLGAATLLSPRPARADDFVSPAEAPIERLSEAEIEALVAPIALYPDVVLDTLLPATTTPLHVVDAARVLALSGTAGPRVSPTWSPAVVAMLQYPDVVRWMSDNLDWLERMGFAVAFQQEDVLAAIQRLRLRARAAGVLVDDEHQRVLLQNEPAGVTYVVIEPVQRDVVYVPVYEPAPLLVTSPVIVRDRPFFRTWWHFGFGRDGPWSRNRIGWRSQARGIYVGSPAASRRWTAPRDTYVIGQRRATPRTTRAAPAPVAPGTAAPAIVEPPRSAPRRTFVPRRAPVQPETPSVAAPRTRTPRTVTPRVVIPPAATPRVELPRTVVAPEAVRRRRASPPATVDPRLPRIPFERPLRPLPPEHLQPPPNRETPPKHFGPAPERVQPPRNVPVDEQERRRGRRRVSGNGSDALGTQAAAVAALGAPAAAGAAQTPPLDAPPHVACPFAR